MGGEESGVEGLVMMIDFIFLIEFYVPAHDNDGLAHEEHKDAPQDGKEQNQEASNSNNIRQRPVG